MRTLKSDGARGTCLPAAAGLGTWVARRAVGSVHRGAGGGPEVTYSGEGGHLLGFYTKPTPPEGARHPFFLGGGLSDIYQAPTGCLQRTAAAHRGVPAQIPPERRKPLVLRAKKGPARHASVSPRAAEEQGRAGPLPPGGSWGFGLRLQTTRGAWQEWPHWSGVLCPGRRRVRFPLRTLTQVVG